MRPTIIFIFLCILSLSIYGQNKIKIDKSLTPDKIICKDTSFWFDHTDTTGQKLIAYPNNSMVACDENFKFGDTIPNCEVNLSHDSLFIHLFKLTYGLCVNLDITCVNGVFKTKLIYNQSNIGVVRTFKVLKCDLYLNQKEFKVGQILVGKITLTFSGSIIDDMVSYEEKKVKGQITGLFKSKVE